MGYSPTLRDNTSSGGSAQPLFARDCRTSCIGIFSLGRRGASKIVPVHEAATFVDGEILDIPGRPRVVYMPGDTEGVSMLPCDWRAAPERPEDPGLDPRRAVVLIPDDRTFSDRSRLDVG